MKRVECANRQEALDLLRYCMSESGAIVPGRHFRDKLCEEGIQIDAAYLVMRAGNIYEPPEEDIATGEWKWKIEGLEPDGKWLAIVFSFKTIRCAFLITIYSVEARGRNCT
jgi:hypothetical protein